MEKDWRESRRRRKRLGGGWEKEEEEEAPRPPMEELMRCAKFPRNRTETGLKNHESEIGLYSRQSYRIR